MCNGSSLPLWAEILLEESGKKLEEPSDHRPNERTCLILLAHGSRDPRWQEPFERLFFCMRQELKDDVKLAYMEFVEPTLSTIAGQCAKNGVGKLRVLPIFMAAGAHLATDVPEEVRKIKKRHPQLEVEVLPPIGEDPRMFLLMQEIIGDLAA